MTRIAVDPLFKGGFSNRTSGGGTVVATNGVLRCQGTGTDSAMVDYFFPIKGGSTVKAMVEARSTQGEARFTFDYIDQSGVQTNIGYDLTVSQEWGVLEIDIVVPHEINATTGCIILGKWGGQNQTVDIEFRNLELFVTNAYGSPLTIAQGAISVLNGSPAVHNSFKNTGIKGFEVGTDQIKILIEQDFPNKNGYRPLVFVSGTSNNILVPLAGQFDYTDDSIIVKFSNGSSFVNISTVNNMYFNLLVTI